MSKLLSDYNTATPINHVYLMPYFYKNELPAENSADFMCFLQLLKYLEKKGQFDPLMLEKFHEAGGQER